MKTVEERFWSKVHKTEGCWFWLGAKNNKGYGQLFREKREGKSVNRFLAHRLAYELFIGPIPEGLQLDHLCRTPHCVNPWHLEPVTARVNLLRGNTSVALGAARTSCPKGHPYTEETLYFNRAARHRVCLVCQREWQRDHKEYFHQKYLERKARLASAGAQC